MDVSGAGQSGEPDGVSELDSFESCISSADAQGQRGQVGAQDGSFVPPAPQLPSSSVDAGDDKMGGMLNNLYNALL